MLSTHLVIGEITKPQGVRGEVKVRPITCDYTRFEGLRRAFLKDGEGYRPIELNVSRVQPEAVYMTIEGIPDRTQAEALRGSLLYVERADAVALDDDSNFICDLIGLHGITDDGRDLGTLRDVMQPGGNDVYQFEGPMGEVLVPALKTVVLNVDLHSGTMRLCGARLDEVAVFDED